MKLKVHCPANDKDVRKVSTADGWGQYSLCCSLGSYSKIAREVSPTIQILTRMCINSTPAKPPAVGKGILKACCQYSSTREQLALINSGSLEAIGLILSML